MLKSDFTSSNQKFSADKCTYSIFKTILIKNRHLNTFANILLAHFNSIGLIHSFILDKFHKIIEIDIDFVILKI